MGERKKILLVEDELDFAKMVKIRLESLGYEVSIAGDAYSGTQAIIKSTPDLIILDLMMPAGGGFSILERIRSIPAKATIPVVIVTGKTIDDAVKEKAKAYGVSAIFSKPYDSVQFVQKIKALLMP